MPLQEKIHNKAEEYGKLASVFLEGAEFALENQWISTDKCLPKQGGHYLCNDGDSHISTLAFCGDKWVNTKNFKDVPLEVIKYWMPIPELPKKNKIKL